MLEHLIVEITDKRPLTEQEALRITLKKWRWLRRKENWEKMIKASASDDDAFMFDDTCGLCAYDSQAGGERCEDCPADEAGFSCIDTNVHDTPHVGWWKRCYHALKIGDRDEFMRNSAPFVAWLERKLKGM